MSADDVRKRPHDDQAHRGGPGPHLSQQDVLTRAGELERELKDLIDGPGPLPRKANAEEVWRHVRGLYLEWWKSEAFSETYAHR
jgi:hypothetical protein